MKRIKTKLLVLAAICAMGAGSLFYAQTNVSKEKIPPDTPADVRAEIKRLYFPRPGVRVKACMNLGEMGQRTAPAIPFLIGILDDTNSVRLRNGESTTPGKAAAEALTKIGKPAAEPLATMLKKNDKHWKGRKWAEKALKNIKDSLKMQKDTPSIKTPLPQQTEPKIDARLYGLKYNMHFGVNGGMYPDISEGEAEVYAVTEQLDKLGMIWLRHPGKGTTWFEVQSTRDTWNFSKLDAVIHNNNHPWVIEVYGALGFVYPFDVPGSLTMSEYLQQLGQEEGPQAIMEFIRTHSVDMDNLKKRADAKNYVRTFVERYKDRIKYWEIGNEGIQAPEAYGIITNTYTWIKEVHPDAKVLITAGAGDDDVMFQIGLDAFDELLANGIRDYFDIVNIHYYGNIGGNFEQRLEARIDNYKAVMAKYGRDVARKPIWVTETSTSSHVNSVLSGQSSEKIQAQHVIKRLVVFSAKGAEKVFWHDYHHTYQGNKFYKCNLIDNMQDRSGPKPAYYTFKLLVEKIGYYKTVETLSSDNIRLYRFTTGPQNKPVFVAWSNSSQEINLDLSVHIGTDDSNPHPIIKKVKITHIIETRYPNQPETETAPITSINVSVSPIFIELM